VGSGIGGRLDTKNKNLYGRIHFVTTQRVLATIEPANDDADKHLGEPYVFVGFGGSERITAIVLCLMMIFTSW
jgi:hypothetical protein